MPWWYMLGMPQAPPRGSGAPPPVDPGKPKKESVPKGERQVEGTRAPEERNTFVVFLRFFHLARRFWNQT